MNTHAVIAAAPRAEAIHTPAEPFAPKTFAQAHQAYLAAVAAREPLIKAQGAADEAFFACRRKGDVPPDVLEAKELAQENGDAACVADIAAFNRLMVSETDDPSEIAIKYKIAAERDRLKHDGAAVLILEGIMAAQKARSLPRSKAKTKFARLEEARVAARASFREAIDAEEVAGTALNEAENTRQLVPPPAALTVMIPGQRWTYDGDEHILRPRERVLDNRKAILDHFKGDEAAAASLLGALAEQEAQQEELDRASGYAELMAAAALAEDKRNDASDADTRAENRLLDCPTVDPGEVAVKRAILVRDDNSRAESQEMRIVDSILRALRAEPPPSTSTVRWDEAIAALEGAEAAERRAAADLDAANAAVAVAAPTPAILIRADTGGTYRNAEHFLDDSNIPPKSRAQMAVALEEWLPRRAAAEAEYRTDELNDAWEDADDALNDAQERVLEQTPPDPAALLTMMRIALSGAHAEYIGDHADNELTISRLLSGDRNERDVALVYRAALRLAGESSPALDAKPFDASGWIDTVRDAGVTDEVAIDMRAALPEWQKDMVDEAVKRRSADSTAPAMVAEIDNTTKDAE